MLMKIFLTQISTLNLILLYHKSVKCQYTSVVLFAKLFTKFMDLFSTHFTKSIIHGILMAQNSSNSITYL